MQIATTTEEPRTHFSNVTNPNRSTALKIDPRCVPRGPLRPTGTVCGPGSLIFATELYRLARPSYLTSKYPTFELRGPAHTNGLPKFRRHRIREGRFAGVSSSLCGFFIGLGCSEQKYAFSALGDIELLSFSMRCELFAPRLPRNLHIRAESMQNLYFWTVPSNIQPAIFAVGDVENGRILKRIGFTATYQLDRRTNKHYTGEPCDF